MRRLWEQIVVGAYRVGECSLGWDFSAPAARAHDEPSRSQLSHCDRLHLRLRFRE